MSTEDRSTQSSNLMPEDERLALEELEAEGRGEDPPARQAEPETDVEVEVMAQDQVVEQAVEVDASAEAAAAPANQPAAEQQAQDEVEVEQPEPAAAARASAPAYVSPAVDDYDKKRDALIGDLAKLRKQYGEGDESLDDDTFARREADIQRDLSRMDAQQERHLVDTRAEAARQEHERQTNEAAWDKDFSAWAKRTKAAGGPDYKENDAGQMQDLADAVGLVSRQADRLGKTLTRTETLDAAERIMAAQRGDPSPVAKPAAPPKGGKPAPARPLTLAALPAASTAAAQLKPEGEFAHLDDLDDEGRTLALMKMSKAQQERYLAG